MGEMITLPFQHYKDRYRKAFVDMQAISVHLQELKEQVQFFTAQEKMAKEELLGAERMLRSAVITQADEPAEPEVRVPELKVLQKIESLQPKPDPDGTA